MEVNKNLFSNVIQRTKQMEVAPWGVKPTHRWKLIVGNKKRCPVLNSMVTFREMTDWIQLQNWRNLQPARTSSTGRWLLGPFLRHCARFRPD